MKAADQIFLEKGYSSLIQNLQDYDKQHSFQNTSLPDWYTLDDEPKSQPGTNRTKDYFFKDRLG
jgi:hypothetical protein